MDSINLKERFGDRFKVEYEESYYAQYGPNARTEDRCYMIIPCQDGHICPWGGSDLAACTKKSGSIAKRLKALPFTSVAQDGDDGANVAFDVQHFEEVAEIMKPRKKRPPLSAEHKRKLAEANQEYRFRHGSHAPQNALESHPGTMPV